MGKEDRAKIRMTVIHFETESSNATLEENVKAISQTLTKALSQPQRIIHHTSANSPSVLSDLNSSEPILEENEEIEAEELGPGSNGTKKTGAARQYRTPKVLNIELSDGEVPLKRFLEDKNPDGDIKRYLAIAFWLKKYRNIPEISADHTYTCYRHMGTGWPFPSDPTAAFRTMKRKNYGWMTSGAGKGTYSINHIGENEVNKMGK